MIDEVLRLRVLPLPRADGERPQPTVVTPGEASTQEKVGTAPSDAVVLFDGKDLSKWKNAKGEEFFLIPVKAPKPTSTPNPGDTTQ